MIASLQTLPPGGLIAMQLVVFPAIALAAARLAARRPARAHALAVTGLLVTLAAPLLTFVAEAIGVGLFPGPVFAPGGATSSIIDADDAPAALARRGWLDIGFVIWGIVSLVLFMRLWRGMAEGVRLARAARPCQDAYAVTITNRLAREAGLRGVVLCRSPALASPAICSWGRSRRLLLPCRLDAAADPRAFEQMIAHELAHLTRRDHWWRLIAECATCVLPWHPLVWRLRRTIYDASEMACDARVVARGDDPTDYAAMLLNLATSPAASLPALSGARARSSLARRIDALLSSAPSLASCGRAWIVATSLVAALTVGVAALAQPRPLTVAPPESADVARPMYAIAPAPGEVDLGETTPGGVASGVIRLVNVGAAPVHYRRSKAACGCTKVRETAPFTLRPGSTLTLPVTVDAPAEPGAERRRAVTFFFDELPPIQVYVRVTTRAG